MTLRALPAAFALASLAGTCLAGPYDGQMVVRAKVTDPTQLMRLSGLVESFWSHRIGLGDMDVQVTAEARRSWVRSMLADVPRPIPKFGSPRWLSLPDGDRRKVAGGLVAAESWAR